MKNSIHDYESSGPWVLKWDRHPTKRIFFQKDYSGGNPFIKIWGTGFQGLNDPPPLLEVDNTSLGYWAMKLNEENSSSVLGIEFAREIWQRLLDAGWVQVHFDLPF